VRAGNAPVASPDEILLSRLRFQVQFLDQVRSGSTSMGQLLAEARQVGQPSTVNPEVKISGGAMVGLLVGLCVGMALDARRTAHPWSSPPASSRPRPARAERGVDESPQPQRGLARR
jgi:hypothetical protein